MALLIVLLSHSGSSHTGHCLRYDGDSTAIQRSSDATLLFVSNGSSPTGDNKTAIFDIIHSVHCD